MRTFASGSAVVISRHASMPFLPGISTSIRMTSGRSLSASPRASSPSGRSAPDHREVLRVFQRLLKALSYGLIVVD